jgi:alkanesulfonate monooxygenase SsuD/methylene tetrahydromethanopterin reductase-like flavin-dependent oxidoreductase (luciferase family)
MVEPQMGGSYRELLDLARWAEERGFDTFARSDHYLDMTVSRPTTDAFTSLAAVAAATSSIRLAVLVSPITFRHPAVIAKAAATLDEISGGRFELGIGTGWMEGEHEAFGLELPPLAERFARLEEAFAYVSAALGRTRGPTDGHRYRLGDVVPMPTPGERVRLIVGGTGRRRTPELAGRFADELNLFGADAETVRSRAATAGRAAAAAGRDPGAVAISTMVSPLVGDHRAGFEERLAATAARRRMDPGHLLDRMRQRGTPHGTVDEAAEGFAALSDLGLRRVYLQQFDALAAVDRENLDLTLAAIRRAGV